MLDGPRRSAERRGDQRPTPTPHGLPSARRTMGGSDDRAFGGHLDQRATDVGKTCEGDGGNSWQRLVKRRQSRLKEFSQIAGFFP